MFVFVSCGIDGDSKLNHKFSRISRPTGNSITRKCKTKRYGGATREGVILNLATDYLNKVMNEIFDKTEASLAAEGLKSPFVGEFSRENFCINSQDRGDLNAFANPSTGQITIDLRWIETMENDAQLAFTIGHELAHILMSHDADYVAPFKKMTDFTELGDKEIKEMFQTCYKLEGLKRFDVILAKSLIESGHEEIDSIRKDFIAYQSARFKQLRKRGYSSKDLINCKTLDNLGKRIANVVKEVESKGVGTDNEKWLSNLSLFKKIVNDSSIRKAVIDSENISKRVASELGEDMDSIYNWKEQEADHVGMEILYRSGLDIMESSKLWLKIMKIVKESPEECLRQIEANKEQDRGRKTHPNTCFRVQDLSEKEIENHANRYKERSHLSKDLFPGELENLQAEMKR